MSNPSDPPKRGWTLRDAWLVWDRALLAGVLAVLAVALLALASARDQPRRARRTCRGLYANARSARDTARADLYVIEQRGAGTTDCGHLRSQGVLDP
jgi:hypothetical protein